MDNYPRWIRSFHSLLKKVATQIHRDIFHFQNQMYKQIELFPVSKHHIQVKVSICTISFIEATKMKHDSRAYDYMHYIHSLCNNIMEFINLLDGTKLAAVTVLALLYKEGFSVLNSELSFECFTYSILQHNVNLLSISLYRGIKYWFNLFTNLIIPEETNYLCCLSYITDRKACRLHLKKMSKVV